MPEWLTKFAKRILSLEPGRSWLIVITIEKGKTGARWVVAELGKVEEAVEKIRQHN